MDSLVSLPGGLQMGDEFVRDVEFRELSGMEEELMLDARRDRKGKPVRSISDRFTDILARCTIRMGSLVREENREPEKASSEPFYGVWSDALAGDRATALVRLRQLSLGDQFVWKEMCPQCKKEIERVEFDLSEAEFNPYFSYLSKELDEELDKDEDDRMSEEQLQAFKQTIEERRIELLQQVQHEVTVPSGKKVFYHLMRRKDEERLANIMDDIGPGMLTALLGIRINSINGEAVKSLKDPRLKHMTLKDRDFLRLHFDEVEGGLDTRVWVECDNSKCGHKFQRPLDPGKPGFFHRLGV